MQRSLFHTSIVSIVCMVLCLAVSAAADPAASGPTDEQWNASLILQFPGVGDFDVYSGGLGVEAQYRRWYGFFGYALSLGMEQWGTESRSSNWGSTEPGRLRGDLTLVPVGASAIGRWTLREGLLLRGEAGFRYAWADSGIRIQLPSRPSYESVDIKDGWIVVAGLGVEQLLTETLMVFGGVRYQHDLVRAGARTKSGVSLMDNQLLSFGLQVGLQLWY